MTVVSFQTYTDQEIELQKYPTEIERSFLGFPGGAVVKNPPAKARDTGSSPGPGRSHMPWSK